jgi:hypothetical protein
MGDFSISGELVLRKSRFYFSIESGGNSEGILSVYPSSPLPTALDVADRGSGVGASREKIFSIGALSAPYL